MVHVLPHGRTGLLLGGGALRPRLRFLERVLPHTDVVCLGGQVATVLAQARSGVLPLVAAGAERAAIRRTLRLVEEAEAAGSRVLLPSDVVAFQRDDETRAPFVHRVDSLQPGWVTADVGQETLVAYREELRGCERVHWNGPLGLATQHPFARGSLALARVLARDGVHLVLTGRDTVEVVRAAGVEVRTASRAASSGVDSRAGSSPTVLKPAGR